VNGVGLRVLTQVLRAGAAEFAAKDRNKSADSGVLWGRRGFASSPPGSLHAAATIDILIIRKS